MKLRQSPCGQQTGPGTFLCEGVGCRSMSFLLNHETHHPSCIACSKRTCELEEISCLIANQTDALFNKRYLSRLSTRIYSLEQRSIRLNGVCSLAISKFSLSVLLDARTRLRDAHPRSLSVFRLPCSSGRWHQPPIRNLPGLTC